MAEVPFTFADIIRRSAELNKKKAEIHVLIQLVIRSINHNAENVPIWFNRDAIEHNGFRYTWDVAGRDNRDLKLRKWWPDADIVTDSGESELVWSGSDANGIPAENVDDVYATMDHLLQQSIKYVGGFRQRLVKMAILLT